jgi:DNA-binding transcriptional LysR family regulator
MRHSHAPSPGDSPAPATDALLRRLRYFVAVGEELHFGRAAQRLNMAQPPLSQQIRRLEQELGYALFERGHAGPSRVAPTAAGGALLEVARRIAAAAAVGLDEAARFSRGERGTLRLAFAASVMLTPAAGVVRAFRDRQPGVQMTLSEMVTTVQLDALRAGEIDAGLMREAPPDSDLEIVPLLRESFAIALPSRHPLASRARLPLRALAREPFVLVPRDAGPAFYDRIIALCASAGFEPDIV